MKMKKTLTAVVAMALVAAVSVAGTMAFLTQKTGPVTNTFKAGNLGDGMKLELWENPVELDTKGQYVITNSIDHVDHNEYNQLLPNSTNAKNPTVTVTNLSTDAYLFIEVVNDETDAIEATVGGKWKLLNVNPTADNADAKVYAYALDDGIVHATDKLDVEVLDGNIFTVKNFTNDTAAQQEFKPLTFKAYICQAAGFTNATEAWNGAFAAAPQV